MSFTDDEINRLREEVPYVFTKITGKTFYISGDIDNESYEKLAEHMRDILMLPIGDIPGAKPCIRLFHERQIRFQANTLKRFDEYVRACKKIIAEEGKESPQSQTVLGGVEIVNSNFKARVSLIRDFNILNFYTAKNIDDGQWYGIFNSWDVPRERYDELKALISSSIRRTWKKNKVLAVVAGGSGSGTSTLLRRLACDFMNSAFAVLWVSNLGNLCQSIDILKSDYEKDFLIIIDDWEFVRLNDAKTFFASIKNAHNISVVIGDKNTTNKYYLDFFNEKNTYELGIAENKQIIDKIILTHNPWKELAKENILPDTIYNSCPLYVLLFLLTYHAEKLTAENGLSQFKSLVRKEIVLIAEKYRGLALALFYWSQLHKKYRLPITWFAFLKLADHYNRSKEVSYYLDPFDKTDPICELLSHYLFLEDFVHPLYVGNKIMRFHHELLVEEGLSQPVFKDWKLSNEIKINMMGALMNNGEMDLATDLFNIYYNYDVVFHELENGSEIRDYYRKNLIRSKSLVKELIVNKAIKRMYSFASTVTDDDFWIDKLRYLVMMSNLNIKNMNIVVENLIIKGCTAPCIVEAYKMAQRRFFKRFYLVKKYRSDRYDLSEFFKWY